MRTSRRVSSPPSALEAYRQILRLIRRMNAEEGTKLPTQNELLHELKICAATLDAAMKWLIEDGVLSRKRRVGTFILTPYPVQPKRAIWRAGLAVGPITRSYFTAVVAHYLHLHGNAMGISDRTYMLSPNSPHSSEVQQRAAVDFTGLQEDIHDGLLDAVLTSTRLICDQLPVCGVAAWERAAFGVGIDHERFISGAISTLLNKGCRHLQYVLPYDPNEWSFGQRAALAAAEERVRQIGLVLDKTICATSPVSDFYAERSFVGELLRHPEELRPDGLIIQDDISAQAISTMLATTDYRPYLAVQTNLQMPISFALPCHPFSLDLNEIAARSVELLIEKLLVPASPGRTMLIPPIPLPEVTPSMVGWNKADRLHSTIELGS